MVIWVIGALWFWGVFGTHALVNPLKEFDTERMARMALALSEHDLVIAHRPGTSKELLIADVLSRAKSAN